MAVQAIGQPVRREEDLRLLTGTRPLCRRCHGAERRARLCAALAACACPHRRDRHSAARSAAPGVLAVLTGADLRAARSRHAAAAVPRRTQQRRARPLSARSRCWRRSGCAMSAIRSRSSSPRR